MKVMYIGPKYYDGKPEFGLGYEHYNFYGTLSQMKNIDVVYFPFDEIMVKYGKEKMNQMLIKEVSEEKPEICFFFLLKDEIEKGTIRTISSNDVSTFNWFGDDQNRFESFSKYYAPLFNWATTTDHYSIKKYHKIGYENIIKTQWGCNNFLYKPIVSKDKEYRYELSFVGQRYNNRSKIIETVVAAGFKIDAFGRGWAKGRIDQGEMLATFSRSKINLNITEVSRRIEPRFVAGIFLREQIDKKITINSPTEWPYIINSLLAKPRAQIKGRTFEIPACGGFLLTQYVDGLEEYYLNHKEIGIFKDKKELIDKITYYLENEHERKKMATAAYKRTVSEHTYQKRFQAIFKSMGF